jgi:hypothetical protein
MTGLSCSSLPRQRRIRLPNCCCSVSTTKTPGTTTLRCRPLTRKREGDKYYICVRFRNFVHFVPCFSAASSMASIR